MVVVGGPFSLPPTVTVPPRLGGGACLGLGVPLSQAHSHLKEALGQEAGRQDYSLETGRTSGALEGRLESAHTEGPDAFVSVCPLAGPVPHREGHLQGHQTHTAFTVHPPAPPL